MFGLFKKKCKICHRKFPAKSLRNYIDDAGNPIQLCKLCTEYAERRAFRKI